MGLVLIWIGLLVWLVFLIFGWIKELFADGCKGILIASVLWWVMVFIFIIIDSRL